jgi:diguanylate cyclase (GGDEF)-like protein
LTWQHEITDAFTLYSVAIIACAATFYSPLFDEYVKLAQEHDGLLGAKLTVVLVFLGIASSVFGVRRLADQRLERVRRLAAERQASSLSLRDPLTLLPNRRCLENEFDPTFARAGGGLTVLLVALERVGALNNLHGHAGADAALAQVAARLRREADSLGFLARIAHDEFAVVLPDADADRATGIALGLVEQVCLPVQVGDHEHTVLAHVGIAQRTPEDTTIGEVLRHAHIALDRARSRDADCCFFDTEMDAHIAARALLEQDLRAAVATDAIRLYFQPIVDLHSGRIESFEALARWHHPQRGVLMPDAFIPLAEDLGLMDALSGRLFEDACRQATAWPAHISLSFNFSQRQLGDPSFDAAILAVLDRTGLAPHRLEVEITETALVNDFAVARRVLRALAKAGVGIVMDDFGTGYSSLRHLRELHFSKIKIDRSFINEMGSNADCAAIVSAVTGLAKCLDIKTVAEGIETMDQLTLARAAGCTLGQGYLFARPAPPYGIDFMPFGARKQSVAAA